MADYVIPLAAMFSVYLLLAVKWGVRLRSGHRHQTTMVFCPSCQNEMVSCKTTSCVYKGNTECVVVYTCKCGNRSEWLFDAPVPVLLDGSCSNP